MKKLMWIGQALIETGYSRVTENILAYLTKQWDVSLLGIGYDGDPHDKPYRIYRADRYGDNWGLNRLHDLVTKERPDVICAIMEPWNLMAFIQEIRIKMKNIPKVVGYCIVDGENMKPEHAEWLCQFDVCVFPTQFALIQAQAAGYHGSWFIIPHGVNPLIYHPVHKDRARRMIGFRNILQEQAFIVGNVNENQPRKRLDLTIEAWATWWKGEGKPEHAFLYLHANKRSGVGWDLGQLGRHHGIRGHLIAPVDDFRYGEASMKYVYNALDVQISTTMGEGWGCTTMEGMACGIPQIVPNTAALGEWTGEAALKVGKGRPTYASSQNNVKLYEPDMQEFPAMLALIYREARLRDQLGRAGRDLVLGPNFRWSTVAAGFTEALNQAIEGQAATKTFLTEEVLTGPSGTGTR